MAKNLKTYVAFIVDESGSMGSIYTEALTNFNEQLQVLKEESNSPEAVAKKLLINGEEYDGVETHASFVKFNQDVNIIVNLEEVTNVEEITKEDYQPSGTTALYDAIGETIERFQQLPDLDDPATSVLFIIITDGMENASKRFEQKRVKSLVDELQATDKWTFTFMGTEAALEQAYDIGLARGNVAAFAATSDGMSAATLSMSDGLRSYYDSRTAGQTSVSSFYDDEKLDKWEEDDKDN